MRRRDLLTSTTTLLAAASAGCTDLMKDSPSKGGGGGNSSVLDDRPDAVYVPTHVDEMEMIGMGGAGDYKIGLMFSFAHGFWTVSGTSRERVDIQEGEDIHLMATVWDPETKTVLPVGSGLTLSIERDGEFITERSPWPMLSQNMGFHFGDNFSLEGDGAYTITASIAGMGIERLGEFDGHFEQRGSVEIEFEFATADLEALGTMQTGDRAGEKGAVDLMEMEMMPSSVLPIPEDLPGRIVGEGESGGATFIVTAVEEPPFVDDETVYLLVSPRTPYNRIPLPMMSVSATLERDGDIVQEGALQEAIEPQAGHHYGLTVDALESGDELTITVDSPPQVSRHEGYETAFLEMPDLELSIN